MKITDLIAQHLLDVHNGDNWTEVNISGTLAGVSCTEAMQVTAASTNTIAMLLNHITFWNRAMVQRAKGIVPEIGPDNGFAVKPLRTEKEWRAMQEDNIVSAEELASAIRAFDESKLEKPILPIHSTAYNNFQGSVEHVHYHLGQMMMIKKLVKGSGAKPNVTVLSG